MSVYTLLLHAFSAISLAYNALPFGKHVTFLRNEQKTEDSYVDPGGKWLEVGACWGAGHFQKYLKDGVEEGT